MTNPMNAYRRAAARFARGEHLAPHECAEIADALDGLRAGRGAGRWRRLAREALRRIDARPRMALRRIGRSGMMRDRIDRDVTLAAGFLLRQFIEAHPGQSFLIEEAVALFNSLRRDRAGSLAAETLFQRLMDVLDAHPGTRRVTFVRDKQPMARENP